ncbi:Type II traffic warden ATPase [Sedimentisphaera cyanobacteriorum]|uniref:Type II traffic warden ATPase n=1 Tax=Sedimentisphaera cyanobacteriorum TaxID=1940790 RepID=A0A1Q2HPU1_9BACT|nr:ATPase, T2SS/T4P/T4SS family [Sedimentisphaera cyanobacteriorum]AQQ09467.1 Type II traffic warden ATPase [Sedimentisphaera cyanobacteriorum]
MYYLSLLADISFSGYIAIYKFIPFVLLFYLWLLLVNWVHFDTKAVQTDTMKWVSIITAGGLMAMCLWLFVPVFIIGFSSYLLLMITTIMVYVIHRNSLVADFEKVLTLNHIKGLLSNESAKIEKAARGFSFVTANGNPVEIPEPKTKEAYGFKTACYLLDDAIWKRAELIKITPGEEEYKVNYVIDGLKNDADPIEAEEMPYLLYYLKQLADLDVEEKRKPQTGKFQTKKDGDKSSWHITTAGSRQGEHITIKKDVQFSLMSFAELGFESDQIDELKKLKDAPKGLFLVAGTKGSGLTSCHYTLLRNHDPFLNSINTLEKSPAGDVQSIIQNVYDPSEGMSYAERLKALIRRGPDIVGVFDCNDPETAKAACEASKKKLIYVSIESKTALKGLAHWIKMVGDKKEAIEPLIGLASSHLVRRLCEECREEYIPNPGTLKKLSIAPERVKSLWRPGDIEYTRGGKPILCENCQGQGYKGRVGVYESFVLSEEVRKEMLAAKSIKEISASLKRNGMQFFQERLTQKISDGSTSINEMIRVLKVLNG